MGASGRPPYASVVAMSLPPLPPSGGGGRSPRRAAAPSHPGFTIEHLIDIKHPSNPVWSRDSRQIAFTWERAGVANLFVVPADGSARPPQVTTDGVPGTRSGAPTARQCCSSAGPALITMALDGSPPVPVHGFGR